MSAGWNGRGVELAASVGSTWGTEVAVGAADGIKMEKVSTLAGIITQETEKTTSNSFPTAMTLGNVEPIEWPIEVIPRHTSATAVDPIWAMAMGVLYGSTTATQQAATAAYLHGGTVASNHALATMPTRFFSLSERIAKTSGYGYLSVPSFMPTKLKITSEAGAPVRFEIGGIGNKVVKDSATNGATEWGNVTYNDANGRLLMHHHLGTFASTGLTGGVWLLQSAAVGGAAPTFTWATAHTEPTSIEIDFDQKMAGVHTITQYSDAPEAEDVPTGTVTMKWHKAFDAFYSGILADLKSLETPTEYDYLLRARWTYPVAIETTYYPYFEVQCARLRPVEVTFDADAGKMMELTVKFTMLAPTASAHLPATFTGYNGGSGVFDAFNISAMNQTTAALLA